MIVFFSSRFSSASGFFSFSGHLAGKLENYIKDLPKVHLVRAPKRQGLIRARLIGAKQALGDVLVFLDSHCEANYGWLEPLLARIASNRTIVVTPDIEVVDLRTFSYSKSKGAHNRGVFNWELTFKWRAIPDYEKQRRKSDADPIRHVWSVILHTELQITHRTIKPPPTRRCFVGRRKIFTCRLVYGEFTDSQDIWLRRARATTNCLAPTHTSRQRPTRRFEIYRPTSPDLVADLPEFTAH